ncbi:hypothetical protein JG688_00007120 [Phytophthora aleatoria]|uniref:Ankyrin repeat protein n=1 Tax=Phytophthora aleatoria TaxID=2496075 RepID=A0A8J5M8C5_9STRA|nr:hypothetical protein JG688_00007120 [Phytophthora aleatoria]
MLEASKGRGDVVWWLCTQFALCATQLSIALSCALAGANSALVEWLLMKGSTWPKEWSAHLFAAQGRLDALKWCDTTGKLRSVAGLLVTAASSGHVKVVSWLMERDTHLDAEACLAIHSAASHGHLEVATYLHARIMPSLCGFQGTLIMSKRHDQLEEMKNALREWNADRVSSRTCRKMAV